MVQQARIAVEAEYFKPAAVPRDPAGMPYVQVAPGGRYFMTEDGAPFLVIGHNEALPWPTLRDLYEERDVGAVEAYLRMLAAHGVTVHIARRTAGCLKTHWAGPSRRWCATGTT
jgi:hypothetical protein